METRRVPGPPGQATCEGWTEAGGDRTGDGAGVPTGN